MTTATIIGSGASHILPPQNCRFSTTEDRSERAAAATTMQKKGEKRFYELRRFRCMSALSAYTYIIYNLRNARRVSHLIVWHFMRTIGRPNRYYFRHIPLYCYTSSSSSSPFVQKRRGSRTSGSPLAATWSWDLHTYVRNNNIRLSNFLSWNI